jgi:predicted Zn-dependent protease
VEANQPAEARAEYRKALQIAPSSVTCLINATWLFAAHQDSDIRSSKDAVRLGQLGASYSRGGDVESAALDALAAAFASAGRYDDAVASAEKAQHLVKEETQRQNISDRLSLYRSRLPFRAVNDRQQ